MKKTIKLCVLVLIFGFFIFPIMDVQAQETTDAPLIEQTDVEPVVDEPEPIIVPEPVLINEEPPVAMPISAEPISEETTTGSTGVSDEVLLDEDIMAEDLGVNKQRLLPTSPYYPVKTIWRGFRSIITFDPVKKVELNLRYANEKLIEAKQVAEEKDKPEIVAKALESYKKELEDVSKIVEKSSEEIRTGAENFAERMIDYSFKQQKLIDRIEKRLTPEQFEKVNMAREDGLDYFGHVITNLVPPEEIKDKITNVIKAQTGSEFKDFKNIEVLKIIEEKVPEQAKEAIQQARENTVQRLQEKMTDMVEVERKKFKEYVENVGGNEIRHLEIINDFAYEQVPEFLHQEMEIAREKAMERIEHKMQEFKREEQKKEFLRHLEQGKMEDIRIIKELENNLAPETIEKVLEIKNSALDNFRQEFEKIEDPEEQTEFLRKMEKHHDVKQLEIFKEMEQIIPQDKKEFFEKMKAKAMEEMEKEINQARSERERDDILYRLAGDMPEHMEIIKEFAPPPELMEEILRKQADNVREKLLNIDDVEKIQHLKDRIHDDSFVRQELERRAPDIFQQVDRRIEDKFMEISKERAMEKLEKAKNEINQAEKNFKEFLEKEGIGEYLKNSPAPQHLENAKKLLREAETAFDQEKYGHALGQVNAAFHQLNSVWRFVKEFELKHEVAHKRFEEMEETMEDMVGDFLEFEVMGSEVPLEDKRALDRAMEQVQQGNLEQAWEGYKERLEERRAEQGDLRAVELPYDKMNLSPEQIQKIKQATEILPIEIKQKLQDLPPEMIIEATEQIRSKILIVPETTTERVMERIEQRIEHREDTTGLANPASEFCLKKGGKLEIRTNDSGGQFGICHLPDGTECEEWALFKGTCPSVSDEAQPAPQVREDCQHVCKNHGTQSEGWYDSCTGELIKYSKCAPTSPITVPDYDVPSVSSEDVPSTNLDSNIACPQWAPPAPDWCKGGRQISGGIDQNGCKLPPKCERTSDIDYPIPQPIKQPVACIQVITHAISGDLCKAFPTPCDVPSGWQKVDKCPEKVLETETRTMERIRIEPINVEKEPIRMEETKQFEGMKAPEGSLGKPSLFERVKGLFQ